ncbi:MAG: hypothetical protein KGL36_03230 [Gammaproteobacteria bacterium]|nr:hypothetical protein [Gammaproteobacteria bacterium]
MSGTPADPKATLRLAWRLSRDLAQIADHGEVERIPALDAERRALLESLRVARVPLDDEGARLWREIAVFNDRALGVLEHRRRALERDVDVAVAGARALRAYAANAGTAR